MRVILPGDFVTMPWKNGGGVTHEIARLDEGGRMLWRLSIAEVASDGPFSAFPGLMRVLTVIGGAGMVLETPAGALSARPFVPVRFPGDVPVTGRLIAGPVRDFNLISDPARVAGDVTAVEGPAMFPGGGAVLALTEGITAGASPLPAGAVALDPAGVTLAPGARALRVALSPR